MDRHSLNHYRDAADVFTFLPATRSQFNREINPRSTPLLPSVADYSFSFSLSLSLLCLSMFSYARSVFTRKNRNHRLNLSRLNRNWTILTRVEKLRGDKRERERWRVTVIITTALMTFARHYGGGPMTTGKQL